MTGADLEAAAADSAASFVRPKKKPFTQQGEPCKNCGTALEGWYCHCCGQNADTRHRSILHLIWEAIEGMFHLDGRLANTLPLLFFNPGKLAKDYMEGRIARHVPPFRTFLVALLLFIFAAEHAIHGARHKQELKEEAEAHALVTPQGRKARADEIRKEAAEDRKERLADALALRDEALKEPGSDKALIATEYADNVKQAEERYARLMAEAQALQDNPNAGAEALAKLRGRNTEAAEKIRAVEFQSSGTHEANANKIGNVNIAGQNFNVVTPDEAKQTQSQPKVGEQKPASAEKHASGAEALFSWKENLAKAVANPDYFLLMMFGLAHRLAVLLLPIMGLSLALVYVNRRQFFIYDHLLVATNLISFSFLVNAIGFVLPAPLMTPWFVLISFWAPVNLFQTLRGGYGSSIVGALFKTFIVWVSSVMAFGLLVSGLMLFTLSQM
ncbi:plasmid stabilization system protein ParE [Caulobacter sp. BE264]|uniref:DUF3667 domain-containing protein n=1 Tax=Caulobacter sp. BE264 TaxID=2817724 RepID=UPI002864A6C9|nr:DUF3667 domain-containing protein [Caulobacter sp. BE264]MDR7232053.1 plasmid stabilization system protein ParE [Caulobacter sp. BE264]